MALLTNARAAEMLGVGAATVKRWADQGVLACIRTVGGHRRFTLEEVTRFRASHGGVSTRHAASEEDTLLGAVMQARDGLELAGQLLQLRSAAGHWAPVVETMERTWELAISRRHEGTITGLEERVSTEKLVRAAALLAEQQSVMRSVPPMLLLATEGEPEVLPLSLVELGLRALGQPTLWAGQRTPLPSVTRAFRAMRLAGVVVLATRAHRKPAALPSQAALMRNACRVHGIPLTLLGAWPVGEMVVARAAAVVR